MYQTERLRSRGPPPRPPDDCLSPTRVATRQVAGKNPRILSGQASIISRGGTPFHATTLGVPLMTADGENSVTQWISDLKAGDRERGGSPALGAVLRPARPARPGPPPRRRPRPRRWGGRRPERLRQLLPGGRRRALPGTRQPRRPVAAAGDHHRPQGAQPAAGRGPSEAGGRSGRRRGRPGRRRTPPATTSWPRSSATSRPPSSPRW